MRSYIRPRDLAEAYAAYRKYHGLPETPQLQVGVFGEYLSIRKFWAAVRDGNTAVVRQWHDTHRTPQDVRDAVLMIAALRGDTELIQWSLANDASPDAYAGVAIRALIYKKNTLMLSQALDASTRLATFTQIYNYLPDDTPEVSCTIARLLKRHGAVLRAPWFALFTAVRSKSVALLKLLLPRDAPPELLSALLFAALETDSCAVVKFLLQAGAVYAEDRAATLANIEANVDTGLCSPDLLQQFIPRLLVNSPAGIERSVAILTKILASGLQVPPDILSVAIHIDLPQFAQALIAHGVPVSYEMVLAAVRIGNLDMVKMIVPAAALSQRELDEILTYVWCDRGPSSPIFRTVSSLLESYGARYLFSTE